ncbi:hypothetical protein ACJ5NV_04840 [Loktanella agnita]|uniref:hypothetical protein n=1 Tax=Loktanella agnita TaxID=287097 RepID=UPI003985B754
MNLWITGPIATYNTAITNAHDRFIRTLGRQDKTDQLQLEVVFLIGFVTAGVVLSAAAPLLATTVATTATGRFVKKITDKLPGVNGGATLANTSLARNLVTGFRDETQSFLKIQGKTELKAGVVNGGGDLASVADIKWRIIHNANAAFKIIIEWTKHIDRSDLTEEQKNSLADDLLSHGFLGSVPNIASRKAELENVMEYTFLLNHIMDMDKLVTTTTRPNMHAMSSGMTRTSVSTSIDVGPSNSSYPQQGSGMTRGGGLDYTITETSVDYDDPGNAVAEEVNRLYHIVNKMPDNAGESYKSGVDFMNDSRWFGTGVGARQIKLAETELTRMANKYTAKAMLAATQ